MRFLRLAIILILVAAATITVMDIQTKRMADGELYKTPPRPLTQEKREALLRAHCEEEARGGRQPEECAP